MNKKTTVLIILVLVVLIAALGGFYYWNNSNQKTGQPPAENAIDCGTSAIFATNHITPDSLSSVNFEADKTFVCMGNNMLTDCKDAKSILKSWDAGDVSFDTQKDASGQCNVKITFGPANQIQTSGQKIFAGEDLICPAQSIVTLFDGYGQQFSSYSDVKEAFLQHGYPGTYAGDIYFLAGDAAQSGADEVRLHRNNDRDSRGAAKERGHSHEYKRCNARQRRLGEPDRRHDEFVRPVGEKRRLLFFLQFHFKSLARANNGVRFRKRFFFVCKSKNGPYGDKR